ncbi:hypothetical protein COP2_028176 [Malus domestica]
MASAHSVRIFACIPWLLFLSLPFSSSVEPSIELSLVISESDRLQLSHGVPVKKFPGSKPGILVKVSGTNSSTRIPTFEKYISWDRDVPSQLLAEGSQGLWSRSMSPFEHQLIDVRTYGSSLESLEVSIEEEFVKYHVTFLILSIIMMSLASHLSKSLVFYYGSGMANWGSPCNIDGTFSGDEASPNWSEEFSCNFCVLICGWYGIFSPRLPTWVIAYTTHRDWN